MVNGRGLFMVLARSAIITVCLALSTPVLAFTNWSRRSVCHKIDLCTQACYSQILPGLYLSNAKAAYDQDILRHLNITHIVTVEIRNVPRATVARHNIKVLHIRAYDSPRANLLSFFPMVNDFINQGLQAGGNVLVHCHYGVSRSATVIIAYIMKRFNFNYDEAFDFVRQKRPFINPNPGFVRQLREYHDNGYSVNGMERFAAYIRIYGRRHWYKLIGAAVIMGLMLPLVILL